MYGNIYKEGPCLDGLVVSASAYHAVGRGIAPQLWHTQDIHKMVQTASLVGMQCKPTVQNAR